MNLGEEVDVVPGVFVGDDVLRVVSIHINLVLVTYIGHSLNRSIYGTLSPASLLNTILILHC